MIGAAANPFCPNVLPGAACVDEDCVYCKIARAEEPRPTEEPRADG